MKYTLTIIFTLVIITSGFSQNSSESVLSNKEVQPLLSKNACIGCHTKEKRSIGPSFTEIAKRKYSNERILELIYKPEPNNWPDFKMPMTPLPFVSKDEGLKIAAWINSLK